MSAYTYNNHQIAPPPGSVISFMGGGTTSAGTNPGDPDGWVICDGQNRTVTDSRFVNLFSILNTYMGVGTNTANSITPPNLQGRFLQGPASAATATQGTGGATSTTLTTAQIPPHTITVNDPGHSHTIYVAMLGNRQSNYNYIPYQGQSNNDGNLQTQYVSTGISAAYVNASQTSVPTVPPYTTMNHIMKY
jgi:microcystin-dependent protein